MRYGLSLTGLSPRHYPEVARAAEEAGFESVWVPDHLVFPATLPATYPYTGDGRPPLSPGTAAYDPWVLLATVAAVTTTLRVGTLVYVLPLRHPLVTARAVLTVDRVSRGRVTLGAGVGWLREEFEYAGESFARRGERTDEIIPLLRRLWTEPVIEHHGKGYDLGPVTFEPKPFQRPIPIEIGGASEAALRRAGRLGDGWIEIGATDEPTLRSMLAVVHEARRAAGREALPFTVTASAGPDPDSVLRYRDLGVDRVVLAPGTPDGRAGAGPYVDLVRRFADTVMTRL